MRLNSRIIMIMIIIIIIINYWEQRISRDVWRCEMFSLIVVTWGGLPLHGEESCSFPGIYFHLSRADTFELLRGSSS